MDRDTKRELREAGASEEDAADLAELTRELERLPEATPRKSWLLESKWRMLRRFDEREAERARVEADRSPIE